MFTGIVEELGRVIAINKEADNYRLKIGCSKVLEDTRLGDSIATNGVCLTVVELADDYFVADVMAETLRRSSLGSLRINSRVNLERALTLNTRLGGHLVSGHIDCVGEITNIRKEKNASWYSIRLDRKYLRYIVEKGSVAIDGISLTVADVGQGDFRVSIIPHTKSETILEDKGISDIVNIELDLVGKYIEKLMGTGDQGNLNMDFLSKCGFL